MDPRFHGDDTGMMASVRFSDPVLRSVFLRYILASLVQFW
jgi:hypothetical protein